MCVYVRVGVYMSICRVGVWSRVCKGRLEFIIGEFMVSL